MDLRMRWSYFNRELLLNRRMGRDVTYDGQLGSLGE